MYDTSITIADIRIALRAPLSAAELGIEQRLGPFLGPGDRCRAGFSLDWREQSTLPIPTGDPVYHPGPGWRMYRSPDAYVAVIGDDDAGPVDDEAPGVLEADLSWQTLTLTETRGGPDWRSHLSMGAGELILRVGMLLTDGLIFHAAGVDDDGRGLMFVGASGAGKSTLLDLWCRTTRAVAMNDDRIAVRAVDGHALCYGTPWGGTADIARNHSAKLDAIFLLEQGADNHIDRIASSHAAAPLLARVFLPYWDAALMQRAMTTLEAIVTRTPVYRLRFRPDPSVVPVIWAVL